MKLIYQNNTNLLFKTSEYTYILISLSSIFILYSIFKICLKYIELNCNREVNINKLPNTTINRNNKDNIDNNNLLDDEELPSYSEAVKEY